MILMTLLLVLSLERVVSKDANWHIERYAAQYRAWLEKTQWLSDNTAPISLYAALLLPPVVLGLIEYWVLGAFFTFIEQSIVLFVCIGCPTLRAIYKRFLNAAERNDLQACSMYTDQLGHCASTAQSDGTAKPAGSRAARSGEHDGRGGAAKPSRSMAA